MNLRVLKSKEILYPRNLFLDISDENATDEMLDGLLYAVEKLSDSERELIALRYGEKLSIAGVAQRLGKERKLVLNEIDEVLSRLSSPMLFNFVKSGKKNWDKIYSLDPDERLKRISAAEGKPIAELDASYLDLPRSVYAALKRSHKIDSPYTIADAVQCVFGEQHSRLISESDRKLAEEALAVCAVSADAPRCRKRRHGSQKGRTGYPQNLYGCIFGLTCPAPDSDMLDGLALAVGEIPEPGRQVITLLYEKNVSYKEIAEQLSLPLEMVRQHESRALRYLRRGRVRRMLRYGANRSNRLENLKGKREEALAEPLERLMTAEAAKELAEIGAHNLAEAKSIDSAACSTVAAYELSDIMSFLGL